MSEKTDRRLILPGAICPETEQAFYNCRIKVIQQKNGEKTVVQRLFCEKAIFPPPGYEKRREAPRPAQKIRLTREQLQGMSADEIAQLATDADAYAAAMREADAEFANNRTEWLLDHAERLPENIERSARRARGRVMDYVLADWDLQFFITLTLNGEAFARDDVPTACRKLRTWLNNRVQRAGLKYVIVPEYHRDGKSVHFHGFINAALRLVDSGTVVPPGGGKPIKRETAARRGISPEDCKTVYNIPDWDYGYTTAIRLYGERLAAARYAAKYVTKTVDAAKGDPGKIGGRWYWSSNNLRAPELIYCLDDFAAAPGAAFDTPAGQMKIVYENTEFCTAEAAAAEAEKNDPAPRILTGGKSGEN